MDIGNNFKSWLAGLVDGEGCFLINRNTQHKRIYYYPRLAIRLRLDDISMLRQVQKTLGVGKLSVTRNQYRNPIVSFQVDGKNECSIVTEVLSGRLRSKKVAEYELWRLFIQGKANGSLVYNELKRMKGYREPSETIISAPVRDEGIVHAIGNNG